MKNYMGSNERSEFVTWCVFLGYSIENFLPKWTKYSNLSEEEIELIDKGNKLFIEAKESVIKRFNKDFTKILERDIRGLQVVTLPKERLKVRLEGFKEQSRSVLVDSRIVDTLASVTMELCARCFKTDEQQENCSLRSCYLSLNTPVFDTEAEGCPYRMVDSVTRDEFFRDFLVVFFKEIQDNKMSLEIESDGEYVYSKETCNDELESGEPAKDILKKFGELSI